MRGVLPRPDDLIKLNRDRGKVGFDHEAAFQERLCSAIADVVTRQHELGTAVLGDGEYGKAMGHRVNYGAWWSYSCQRLGGLELSGPALYDMPSHRSEPGKIVLTRPPGNGWLKPIFLACSIPPRASWDSSALWGN
jgi:5-methyltetrahydropteroyltriglutamate--homocysteine methyltransferase